MVKIAEVIEKIEEFAPISLAESFDNCGVKIGNIEQDVRGILVTVDTNVDAINEAVKNNCNLILEHHPSIWVPLKSLDISKPLNYSLLEAYRHNVVIYSAHTNVDYAVGGLNDYVAKKIGLKDIVYCSDYTSARIGKLSEYKSLKDFTKYISEVFQDDNAICIGEPNKLIKTVAIINGSGGTEKNILETYNYGADVLITSEVKHSVARLAKDLGYAIIQIGHFASEAGFMSLMKNVINESFPEITVLQSQKVINPINRRE